MSKYNDQYYIVSEVFDESTLYLKALKKSADRDYGFYKLSLNDEPLYFENAYKEDDKKNSVIHHLYPTHMNMNYVIINQELRDKIQYFDIEYTQLYPAVIIDDNDKYHEGYWLINIYGRLDCLDYEKCTIKRYSPGSDSHRVKRYFLSESTLDLIPEERRLIFRPANTDQGYTFFHQKIVDIFNEFGDHSLRFFRVSEWEAGMQFE